MNLLLLILLFFASNANAVGSDEFLPADKAFKVSSRVLSANSVALGREIAEDCYLYRHRFKIESLTPGIKISNSQFPPGQAKEDHQFGKVEIFKKEVNVVVGLERVDPAVSELTLKIVYQGCAESVLQRKPGALRNGTPFAELPDAFKTLQKILLKRAGGDREMADVLALVLLHEEQDVLAAVELALETGAPSKQMVMNLLSRLTEEAPMPPVEIPTALVLQVEPLANVARYDSLLMAGNAHAS